MEYAIVGSVLALLASMKFTAYKGNKHQEEYKALVERVVTLEKGSSEQDKVMLQNVMQTVQPIAVAVQKLNREVGIQ